MIARCLALLVLALGLVLMHHTVALGPPAPGRHAVEQGVVAHAAAPDAPHPEHGPGGGHGDGHAGMLLHLCLAVLAALGVVLLMVLHARRRPSPDDDRDDAPVRAAAAPARPPPVPLRLARLQVLGCRPAHRARVLRPARRRVLPSRAGDPACPPKESP